MIEHHVYFAVFGFDDDPDVITRIADRTPDDIWRQGESYSALTPEARRMENRWILASNLDQHASHREHFEALLSKLEALGDNLTALRQRYRCGIGVSHYFFMDDPDFYLPGELMDRYRALSLTLTFDQLGLDASPAAPDA
ncbi:MAG: DUF4279 domain-containing protein [Alcanivorax sp.]|nr:DUF4279 domain-containing protein [Alcanivorax sp.]